MQKILTLYQAFIVIQTLPQVFCAHIQENILKYMLAEHEISEQMHSNAYEFIVVL